MPVIQFTTRNDRTSWGDTVAIVSSWDNWDPQKAVPLKTDEATYPIWSASIEVPDPNSTDSLLEYQYVVIHSDGTVRWEDGGLNRTISVGSYHKPSEIVTLNTTTSKVACNVAVSGSTGSISASSVNEDIEILGNSVQLSLSEVSQLSNDEESVSPIDRCLIKVSPSSAAQYGGPDSSSIVDGNDANGKAPEDLTGFIDAFNCPTNSLSEISEAPSMKNEISSRLPGMTSNASSKIIQEVVPIIESAFDSASDRTEACVMQGKKRRRRAIISIATTLVLVMIRLIPKSCRSRA